jgi:uncharacterized membrane-anchored protein YhcB (DUF1043 family)
MIKAKLTYSIANLQKAFSIHTSKVFPIRGRILLYLGLLLIWTGLILLLINYTQQVKPTYIFYIIAGIVFIIVHVVTTKNLGRQAYKQLNERAKIEYQLSFSKDGFDIDVQNSKQHYDWSAVIRAVITTDIILIYISKQTFYFVEQQHLIEGTFTDLQELIRKHVHTVLQ